MARLTHRHLLERETELDELRVLIRGATAGAGRLVIVEGAAGAGKSALVAAAADHAAKAGVRVLAASGSELERDFAFGAIRQLFEPVLAGAPAAGTARLLAGADAIAAHLSLLRPSRSVEVVAALVSAAREALSRAAPEAAIRWLRRALAEEAPQPPRAALLFELGQAEMAVRDPASVDHLREALALATEPDLRARIAVALTELLIAAGAWEAGNEIGTAAVGELGDRDPELVVELETIRAAAMAHDPRLVATFEDNRERLEELATGDGWAAHALTAMLACVSAIRGEEVERVAGRIEHALGDGLLLSRAGGGWAGAQVAGALGFAQEYERALALSEEILAEGPRSGALVGVLTGVGYRGHVHDRRGELIEAETELRTILDLVMASGMGLWITAAFYLFAEAILERPSLDDVAQRGVALELEPRFLSTASGSIMLEFRGRLALARGDRSAAVADLRVCAGIFRPLGYGPLYSSWRSALALALPPEQRPEAMSLVAEELALARATGLQRPCGVALRAAGLLEGGEPGIALLRESAALLELTRVREARPRRPGRAPRPRRVAGRGGGA